MAEYLDRESVLVILDSFLKAHEEILDAPPQCNLVYHAMRKLPAADVAPVVHGRWIEEKKQTLIPVEFDDAGEPVLHDYVVYRCDQCGRTAGKKEPYCHCGAKMDLKEG